MPPRLALTALLLAIVPPGGADAATSDSIELTTLCGVEADESPDPGRLGEEELKALALATWKSEVRAAAIGELHRRFPSDGNRALAMNAEALGELRADRPERAFAAFARVEARFGRSSADPAVGTEIARSLRGRAQSLDLRADLDHMAGRPADFGPGSEANRMRRTLVERFGGHSEPAIRLIVGEERLNLLHAARSAAGGRYDPGPYLALAADYGNDPHFADLVAEIMFDMLMSEQDPRRKLGFADAFLDRFAGVAASAGVREKVRDAFGWKAFAQERLGDLRGAERTRGEEQSWAERTERRYSSGQDCV
jgi:hypothetical protein